MSITVVHHDGCRSHGLLVRAYVAKRVPKLNTFLAFKKHGGEKSNLGFGASSRI
jgi:hypothetical protein